MRDLVVAVGMGVIVVGLLVWVGLGGEILRRLGGDEGEPQRLELVVVVTDSVTQEPLSGTKVVLGSLSGEGDDHDRFTIVSRKLTDPSGEALFQASLVQDRALVLVERPGYATRKIVAPDLWMEATNTVEGFELALALTPDGAAR